MNFFIDHLDEVQKSVGLISLFSNQNHLSRTKPAKSIPKSVWVLFDVEVKARLDDWQWAVESHCQKVQQADPWYDPPEPNIGVWGQKRVQNKVFGEQKFKYYCSGLDGEGSFGIDGVPTELPKNIGTFDGAAVKLTPVSKELVAISFLRGDD